MRTHFELSQEQIDDALAWKEKHIRKDCGRGQLFDFHVMFPEMYSQDKVAYIKCFNCTAFGFLGDSDCIRDKELSHDILFMGNGANSQYQVDLLHRRLAYALSHSSGEQQNGGMGTTYDENSAVVSKHAIDDVILDIIAALGASKRFTHI